ncbi:MAG: hypothetical protein U9Q12_00125, partial [Patescibacteria group bacterium]|nr:hypothetical protein [Patescibacteria group bacterium]
MISQTAKALTITAIILFILGFIFVWMMSFFDAKNNNETVTQNIIRKVEIVKGGDKEADPLREQTVTEDEYKPEITVEDEDGGTDIATIEKKETTKTNKETNTQTTRSTTIVNLDNTKQTSDIDTTPLFSSISLFKDVNTSNASSGTVLAYNGDQWVPVQAGLNTDNQLLSINNNELSIENGNTVTLETYQYTAGKGLTLKDKEEFKIDAPTCNSNEVLTWDGSNFKCITSTSGVIYTPGDAISLNNNKISVVSPTCNGTDKLQWSGTTFICSPDQNTDTLQTLTCTNGQIAQYNGSDWVCANNTATSSTFISLTDTPASYSANQLVRVNSAGNALEYYSDAPYYDNTDNQNLTSATLNPSTNLLTITIEDGNPISVDLTNLINDTDYDITNEIQDLNLTGDNLTITNNSTATTIDLSPYTNTDNQQIDNFTLSANILTLEMQRDGQAPQTVNLSAYVNTDSQAISLASDEISITGNASTVDLTPYINTDNQTADTFNIQSNFLHLSLENDGSSDYTVNLNPYLDNTDTQTLSFSNPNISITGGNSIDISGIDTNTTYTASGTLLNLAGTNFSLNEGTLTNNQLCTYVSGTGLVCTTDPTNWNTAYNWGDHAAEGYLTDAPSDGNTYGRNNGAWATITSGGTPAGTSGAIQFNSSGAFGADDNNLFWDDASNMLGVGTSSPGAGLHINYHGANTQAATHLKIEDNQVYNSNGEFAGIEFSIHNGQSSSRGARLGSVSNMYDLAMLNEVGDTYYHTWNDERYYPGASTQYITGDATGIGIGIATPMTDLHIAGGLHVENEYYDSSGDTGSSGQILSSTAVGTNWIDAPIGGATTFLGLTDTPSSYTANQIFYTDGTGVTSSLNFTFDGNNLTVTGNILPGGTTNNLGSNTNRWHDLYLGPNS